MEDDVDPADGVVHALVAPQLPLDDLDVGVEPGEVVPVAGGEVVEHAHAVAALEQRVYQARADEAAAAGDEDAPAQRGTSATTWKFAKSVPGCGSRSSGTRASSASAPVFRAATSGAAARRARARPQRSSM